MPDVFMTQTVVTQDGEIDVERHLDYLTFGVPRVGDYVTWYGTDENDYFDELVVKVTWLDEGVLLTCEADRPDWDDWDRDDFWNQNLSGPPLAERVKWLTESGWTIVEKRTVWWDGRWRAIEWDWM